MTRIAHVTATFPPYHGGTGNVCYHNARVLAERGYDVEVFTAAWAGELDDPPSVRVHRLRPLARFGNAPILPQLLHLGDVDLVHLHYPFYAGAEFVALSGRPYVVTYHHDVELRGVVGWAARLHARTVGRWVLRRAARLCPTSLDYLRHSAVAELCASRSDRIIELPNGVDTNRFLPGSIDVALRRRWAIPDDALVLLFVGTLDRAHYFKGVPTLLRAISRTPSIYALLVGDGDLRCTYEGLAKSLGVADRVRFTGSVSVAELPSLYRAADALVLPSDTRGEAFGMVLLEAMASGRVVIASDLPGVRAVVDDNRDGWLFPAGDVPALALAIRRLADTSPERRLAMGMAGRHKVESRYSWDRIGDRLDSVYVNVIGEGAVRYAS